MRYGVLPMTPKKKRQSSECVGETSSRSKKLIFQRSRIKSLLIIFFRLSRRSAQKFVPEGEKTINAEFYKGEMDRLLKRIQRVRPAAFCCRDFFLLHDNAAAHKAASVCQFLTPKNVTTLDHPVCCPDLSPPDYFLFPKLKMKFADNAEIQEAVTDELKKVQKEEFSAAIQKLYDCAKACMYTNAAYFE